MQKICVLVWCLFSAVNALGQQTKPLTLTGRVVDSYARPLAGAEVTAYEKFYNYSNGQEYTKVLDQIKKTDANGHFVINADSSSQYDVFIVARKKGLALGWDGLNYSRSDEAQGNFNIILEPPCVLVGVVMDETGNPVAGAKVQAIPKNSYLSRLRQRPILAPEQWFTTQTDTKGKFSFDNFAVDVSADFWIKAPGKVSVYKYTTHYTSSCGFEVGRTDVRLVLPPEAKIQGRVIDKKNGDPVAGIGVLIQPDNIREHKNPYCPHQAVSALDGQFSFEGIPAGKHLLEVLSPEKEMAKWVGKTVKVEVLAGQTTKDVVVEVEKGAIIETVVREGTIKKPLHNIRVSAYGDSSSANAWTDIDGIARLRVLPGKYDFYASGKEYSYHREPVTVAKGLTTRLEILLDHKPSASGIVLDESGQPVAGALVRAHPFGDEVLTDAIGGFEVGFDPRRPCKFLFVRYVERNLAAIIETRDDSKPIKVMLKPALSIAGQVTDANGVGIPAARLSLCVHLANCLSRFGCEVLADARGRYQMKAVPPEQAGFDYRISVNASGYGPKEYERISITGEPGTPVEMETLVLQPADQSISGVVVNAEGKPAVRVPIFLHGRGQPERSTATDNNGRFTIKRICKGQLRLQANFDSSPGGSGFLEAQGGDRDVKIILGQEGVHRPHVSLVGKPLPELKDLKADLPPTGTEGKMILVCFWDMEQRPSRYCIRQLAKQANQLKQKGIIVVVVNASKVDEDTLNEWVKKNTIPFPVGMVQGDEEKTRFAWGVRSLPWLILTDKEHVVAAEGFGLDELNSRIDEITSQIQATRKISGVVRDITGDPLEGAEIRVVPAEPSLGRSNADGRFDLEYEPKKDAGHETDYYLSIRHKARNLVALMLIDEDTKSINLRLNPAVTLKGAVVDTGGRSVANAEVRVLIRGANWKGSTTYDTAQTDANGQFLFKAVSTELGISNVIVTAKGYCQHFVDRVDTHDVENNIKLKTITLHQANLSVSGVVVDVNDRPVSGATVRVLGGGEPRTDTITDTEGKFNVDKLGRGGIRIKARRSGDILLEGFVDSEAGATDVKVKLAELYESPRLPKSIVGRSLPEFNNVKITFNTATLEETAILLCFFDMQQRPSRYCIRQLAKQANQLKQKGLIVVAVHASKIDENSLNEWIKNYNIPLPIGMVQGDVEKSRFAWGVRSLPWLILTDSHHIIRAEGFSLAEMDDKIKDINDAEE